tara:strand:+ start:2017 stop:2424 length:408 start_codon:yes stop_codon:yes gene_type:complete
MASILKVDTITGVATAGSIAITGEGNSTTTNLQQGLCKVWINFNGTGTIATRDSFNVASITDGGTGLYTVTITNDFNNDDYSTAGAAGEEDDSGGNRSLGLRARAAGSQNLRGFRDGVSADDMAEMQIHIMGDLA